MDTDGDTKPEEWFSWIFIHRSLFFTQSDGSRFNYKTQNCPLSVLALSYVSYPTSPFLLCLHKTLCWVILIVIENYSRETGIKKWIVVSGAKEIIEKPQELIRLIRFFIHKV